MIMHASRDAPRATTGRRSSPSEALKALGPQDYCGVIHWGPGSEEWLWGSNGAWSQVGEQPRADAGPARPHDARRHARLRPGDGHGRWRASTSVHDAAVKHMIIISDGDPSPPSHGTINGFEQAEASRSRPWPSGRTARPDSRLLQNIATATGGKYYVVNNPKALPRIFQREARRVARPLIYENRRTCRRSLMYPHEMLSGIDEPLPPITGFVHDHASRRTRWSKSSLRLARAAGRARTARSWPAGPTGWADRGLHHRRRPPLGQRLDRAGRTTTSSSAR